MSDAVNSDVTADEVKLNSISDEQFDEYFKSKGESYPDKIEEKKEGLKDDVIDFAEKKQEKKVGRPPKSQKEEKDEDIKIDDEPNKQKNDDSERNYKGMAHEERQKRQEETRKREELQQEMSRMRQEQEQMRQYITQMQQLNQQQQMQQQVPSFDENPLDNLRYQQELANKQLHMLHQAEQQRIQTERLRVGEEEFKRDYREKLLSYGQENNVDIKDVYNYLTNYKQKEYQARGLSATEANQELIKEELSIVGRAYQRGLNPGEVVYNIAKALGYRDKSSESEKVNPQVDLLSQANEKLANIEKGIAASRSLNGTNTASDRSLSLPQILNLPPEEFERLSNDKNVWERINQKLSRY